MDWDDMDCETKLEEMTDSRDRLYDVLRENIEYINRISPRKQKKTVKSGSKKKKKKKIKKKKKVDQGGGFIPCLPCLSPFVTGAGVLSAGAGAVAAGKYYSSSSSSSSSSKIVNGNITRNDEYIMSSSLNGKKKKDKFKIKQKNKKVTYKKGKEKMKTRNFRTIKAAERFYNKLKGQCKKNKYKKC